MKGAPDPARSPDPRGSVFISHSSSDAALGAELVAALEAAHCRCWIAPRDIPPASSWPEAIAAGVQGSRALVVLLTARSIDSSHILREVELAIASHVPVIPLRLDATPLAAGLKYLLSSVQWIDSAGDAAGTRAAKVLAALERTRIDGGPRRRRLPVAWLAAALVVGAVVVIGAPASRRSLGLTAPAPAPPPVMLPAEAASLPYGDLLQTVWTSAPPAAGTTRPALSLDILASRAGGGGLVAIEDGDSLRSNVDLYVVAARPTTPGHLYVFQIDSRGSVFWLFPRNDTCDLSTGTNPVLPGRIEIPGDARGLSLDDVTGPEHLYAVFMNARWPELERRLAASARAAGDGRPLPPTLIARRTRGVAAARRLPQDAGTIRVGDRDLVVPVTSALLHEASGSTLIINRWFQHE